MFLAFLMRKLEMFRIFCLVKLSLIADFKTLSTEMNSYCSKIRKNGFKYFFEKKRVFLDNI